MSDNGGDNDDKLACMKYG